VLGLGRRTYDEAVIEISVKNNECRDVFSNFVLAASTISKGYFDGQMINPVSFS
jgi:hypothetical protein